MFPAFAQGQGAFLLVQFQNINRALFFAPRRIQRAKASNQNVIVGNLGLVRTGDQSANAVNA
jgi:hypothetical protein